jgi:xylulokinase
MLLDWYHKTYAKELDLDQLFKQVAEIPSGNQLPIDLKSRKSLLDIDECKNMIEQARAKHAGQFRHGHYVQSIIQVNAFSLQNMLNILFKTDLPSEIIATGGGARSRLWRKLKTEITGVHSIATNCTEPACRGAAMFAAIAAKWFHDITEISAVWISTRE